MGWVTAPVSGNTLHQRNRFNMIQSSLNCTMRGTPSGSLWRQEATSIMSCEDILITGTSEYSSFISSKNVNIEQWNYYSATIATKDSSFINGMYSTFISSNTSLTVGNYCSMVSSSDSEISTGQYDSVIASDGSYVSGNYSSVISSARAISIGNVCSVIASESCTIAGSYNLIAASNEVTVSGNSYIAAIACSGATTARAFTTHVDTIHVNHMIELVEKADISLLPTPEKGLIAFANGVFYACADGATWQAISLV